MAGTLRSYLSDAEIAALLDVDPSTVWRKEAGVRHWKLTEMRRVLAHIREHHDPAATLDSVFGAEELAAAEGEPATQGQPS